MLLVDASSGRVLHAENATYPWYPASVTKLMTAYVTLQAVKNRRLTLDSLLTVSARAAAQAPSKMGFKPGTTVTVDNALKMLMVKSANDVAVVLAEGVSGSIEKFADDMNTASRRLGMTQSSWVNPNGLPAEGQISSARDMAILARALLREFPEYDLYWNLPGIRFGKKVMRNYNSLIGRYAGADGMKTGFICASGFNLVASASRGNRRLIAVVLGAPSGPVRAVKAAALLERGFNGGGLNWLTPSLGSVETLQAIDSAPPDLREAMCGKHRRRPAAEEADNEPIASASSYSHIDPNSSQGFMLSSLPPSNGKASALLAPAGNFAAVAVFTGPSKKAAPATDSQIATVQPGQPVKPPKTKGKQQNQVAAAPAPAAPKAAAAPARPVSTPAAPTQANPAPQQPAPQVASAQPDAQTISAPAGVFGPPPDRFAPAGRAMPTPTDTLNSRWMSFTSPANAAPAPLTAAPAPAPQTTAVPMPRPRPKQPKPAQ
jgi:D-alanyl-D-alanine carboxypeptidase